MNRYPQTLSNSWLSMANFASLFRWLGTLAVIAAASSYLLQGLELADSSIRHWACLGMMIIVALSGLFSQRVMKDTKTARLLFMISIGLVSVQFTHLGSLVFDYFGNHQGVPSFIDLQPASNLADMGYIAGATLLASLPVCIIGFKIMARAKALPLVIAFLASNSLLLLPYRSSFLVATVIVSVLLITFACQHWLFKRDRLFSTPEGIACQLLMLAVPVIAVIRSAFYFGELAGYSTILLSLGLIMLRSAAGWISSRSITEVLLLGSVVLVITGWHNLAMDVIHIELLQNYFLLRLLPIVGLLLTVGHLSPNIGRFYRILGMSISALLTYLLCMEVNTLISTLLSVGLAIILTLWGVYRQYREPALSGVVLALLSSFSFAFHIMAQINTDIWIALGILGFFLVMGATLIERFGGRLVTWIPGTWKQVSEWK